VASRRTTEEKALTATSVDTSFAKVEIIYILFTSRPSEVIAEGGGGFWVR
jgi:hypothetical protein